jgi:hypothetical protein
MRQASSFTNLSDTDAIDAALAEQQLRGRLAESPALSH